MNLCFVSYRTFEDGPIQAPFPESDPANIAYAMGGSYLSYYTLRRLNDQEMERRLAPYDPVIVTLDAVDVRLGQRIIRAAAGRAVGYSEGHIGDYQRLSPLEQTIFVDAVRATKLNLLYWERYVPFYQALGPVPVEYLPYPYVLDMAREKAQAPSGRESLVVLPTGLAGATRNGLVNLLVGQRLLADKAINSMLVCMDADTLSADIAAVQNLLYGATTSSQRPSLWRRLLTRLPIDYRPLLRWRDRFRPSGTAPRPSLLEPHPGLRVLRRTGWLPYLQAIAPARLMLDMNNRETAGRNALDCAALGIPCVGTNRSDLQAKLFPLTTLEDPWDVEGALVLSRRLLSELGFWNQVVDLAAERIVAYDVEPFRQRFAQIATRYGLGQAQS